MATTRYGKPEVPGLSFSISHSSALIGLAFSTECMPGFDVESIRPIPLEDFKEHFSKREWSSLKNENDFEAFYRLWTSKEAVVKADGRGLSIPLQSITLEGDRAMLEEKRWCLFDVAVPRGYRATLASNKPCECSVLTRAVKNLSP